MHIDHYPNEIAIVGGGIGGLVTALSFQQTGIPTRVFESVPEIRALGVGINLLPHAVRELDALGLLQELEAASVSSTTLAYFTKRGQEIWTEPRGKSAGYQWPQLSIHRGTLHTILYAAAAARLGADRVETNQHLLSVENTDEGIRATFGPDRNGPATRQVHARALIAADGIHSVVRAGFYPDQGAPRWSGALLWRGLAVTDPVLDGRTMIWAGHPDQKFVGYPILDLPEGKQLFNFIAELRSTDGELAAREDWNKPGDLNDFLPQFESWKFDWLDVPTLVRSAPGTFLFPMIDRDPVDRWTWDRITLLGDAAHPMYPIGSNGASQAILDARTLAGCLRSFGDDVESALAKYEEVRRPSTSAIVLANRGMGPELPMRLVEERAPDGFGSIGDVISPNEIAEVTEQYRRTAGFALAALADSTSLADRNYSAK